MDPLTHFLTGACMGRAGFNRKSALATVTMVLAAEAADIDVLWALKSSTAGLQHHRGITHSFVGVPFIAAAVLLLVYLCHRLKLRLPPTACALSRGAAAVANPLGISLLLRRAGRSQPFAARLHDRLRHSPVRAVQLSLVLLGPRLHHRSRHAACAHRRAGSAFAVRLDQPGNWRAQQRPARPRRERSSPWCVWCSFGASATISIAAPSPP